MDENVILHLLHLFRSVDLSSFMDSISAYIRQKKAFSEDD